MGLYDDAIKAEIADTAKQHGVDPTLALATFDHESGFNPKARNPKSGASGIAQLMPQTAKQYGVKDVFNPIENIKAGVQYLADLVKQHGGDTNKVLATYGGFKTKDPSNYIKSVTTKQQKYASFADEATGNKMSFADEALAQGQPQATAQNPVPSWKSTVSTLARPLLEGGGMIAGGLAATPETLGLGTVPGAALGYAGGRQIANKLDEYLGMRKPQSVLQELGGAAKDIGTGAAMEMGGQIAGKAIPSALGFAGRGVKQLLGASTGTGPGTMEEALKGGEAFTSAMRGKVSGNEIVDNVRSALQDVKSQRAAAYQIELSKIKGNTEPIDISPIKSKMVSLVQQYGGKVNADGSIADLSRLALGKSGRRDISDIIETVQSWGTKEGDNTALGLDTLKRQLDDFYSDSSQARQFVASLRNKVKDTIVQNVPEYANMTKGYADATNMIKDIESGLMVRKNAMTGRVTGDMTLRRLMSAMKSNNELRLDLLNVLGNKASKDLSGQVAGYVASDIVPRGLVGKLAGGSAAYAAYLNPKFWPLLAASSPRLVGEFLRTYGAALRTMPALGAQGISAAAKLGSIATVDLQSRRQRVKDMRDGTEE